MNEYKIEKLVLFASYASLGLSAVNLGLIIVMILTIFKGTV